MQSNIPLAERLRPRTLDEYIGQEHLVGPQGVFRKFIETGNVPSFILWGPPGVGKTTLAKLVATALERKLFTLSAVTSGVKEVREVIEQARKSQFFNTPSPFLFIDEIHRFNKSQQDSLLGAVEQGVVTLIGATTENPSFEVISPLLSRCQVYVLKAMEEADLQLLLERAVTTDPTLRERGVEVVETEALFRQKASARRDAVNRYLWDDENGIYRDYDWRREQLALFSAAAIVPLYVGMANHEQADRLANAVRSRLLTPGGILASEYETGEQWDKPNGWAPLQWMAIQGFKMYGDDLLGDEIARSWLKTVNQFYLEQHKMIEKYHIADGVPREGGGGEYPLQDGFGWTNGVNNE